MYTLLCIHNNDTHDSIGEFSDNNLSLIIISLVLSHITGYRLPKARDIYSVFQKSDAKIEIIITATNLIRIKYSLSSLNHHLSGANVANFNKIHCTVFEQQLFKKWSSKTQVLKVVTICTDICMSLVQTVRSLLLTDFMSADPVASICRRSRSSAEQDQSLSGNSSNNFLAL